MALARRTMQLVSPTKLSTPLPLTGLDALMLLLIRSVVLGYELLPLVISYACRPDINYLIKVINKFKATNAGHKDMLAVLAAVTEVRYTIQDLT